MKARGRTRLWNGTTAALALAVLLGCGLALVPRIVRAADPSFVAGGAAPAAFLLYTGDVIGNLNARRQS